MTAEGATPLCDQLEALEAKLAELKGSERELHRTREALTAERRHLADVLLNTQAQAMAQGADDAKEVKRLRARAEAIERELADTSALEVTQRAIAMKTGEIAQFVTANVEAMLAERHPVAREVQELFTAWLRGFDAVCAAWSGEEQWQSKILRLADGRSPQELPAWTPKSGDIRSGVRDLLAQGVPLPAPRMAQTVRIVNYADPNDPEHRKRQTPREDAPVAVWSEGQRVA